MYQRFAFAALVALIGFGGAARAEIYSAGPAYGGPTSIGGSITCRVVNVGLASVTITTRQIIDNTGGLNAPTADNCNVPLAPTKNCSFSLSFGGNLAFTCRLIAIGTEVNLSGVAEIQAPNHSVLNTLPLQK